MSALVVSSTRAVASPYGAFRPLQRRASPSRSTSVRVRAETIRVCVNKECKRAGSLKTCKMLQGISQGTGVKIEEVLCLDECGMGPNVEIAGRIVNGVKTEADVKAVFDWTRTEFATEEEEEKQDEEGDV